MRIPLGDLSQLGIIKDIRDNMLPPNAWTDGSNIRFYDGKVMTARGGTRTLDPPPVPPYWLLYGLAPSRLDTWIVAGQTQVFAYQNLAYTEITRASGPYTATGGKWNGGILAGATIMNNSVDMPQYWQEMNPINKLVDLPNWPATWRTQVIRPYLNFLVALNATEGGTQYLHRVRWSDPAQPGNIPDSWDDTDPTKSAGIAELTDVYNGQILDGEPLRDVFIIYKQRSTWGMKFTGGPYVMDIYPIFHTTGTLTQNCMCNFGEPAQHFVFTGEDLIAHDGQQRQSLADKKLRRWIVNNIDLNNWQNSYVVPYTDQNEIWTCIPTKGTGPWPNLAIVWNIVDGTFSYRTLTNAAYMDVGVDLSTIRGLTWVQDTDTWDIALRPWDTTMAQEYSRIPLQADPVDTAIIRMDETQQMLNTDYDCTVERTGLALAGTTQSGEPLSNKDVRKLVRGMWISASGNPFTVQVSRQHEIESPINWGNSYTFTPGTDTYVGVMDDGDDQACRLFGIRFMWEDKQVGELNSIDVDVEPLGEW